VTYEAFQVGDSGDKHEASNPKCEEGWCEGGGADRYPRPCVCGGLVHASFLDESYDDVLLQRKCDRCGDDYDEAREG